MTMYDNHQASRDPNGYYIRTFTGKKLYWDSIGQHDYDIRDIAHALSMKCRWSGHVKKFFSVGQHSVMVSRLLPADHQMAGLLHDASEAYTPDFPSPLKWWLIERGFTTLQSLELELDVAIAKKFGSGWPRNPEVKKADLVMLATEHRDLMPPGRERWHMADPLPLVLQSWTPARAEDIFLREYNRILAADHHQQMRA
jgi:hypothetical protein